MEPLVGMNSMRSAIRVQSPPPAPRLSLVGAQPKEPAAMVESAEKRLILFTRLLAVFVLLCLALSWKLWLSSRLYPLVPVLGLIPAFPYPFDYVVLGSFCAALVALVVRPRSKILNGGILAAFTLLFLQDQSRVWPSFYQFFFVFLIVFTYRRENSEADAERILAGIRFILAAVYFWGGVQKLTPQFFYSEFPWFLRPLTGVLPVDIPYLPAIGVFAAVFETLFGIGLLTKRFRTIALYEAMLMHALIFFLIGPIRHDWNNSSWMWSVAMAVQAWVAFYKAPAFEFRTMFGAGLRSSVPQGLAIIFIGILPVLNNVNRWDSALSFNVYTGNVAYAQLRLSPQGARHLPPELSAYVTERDGWAMLDITAWTEQEFNANPYPEERIFKAVLGRICSHVPDKSVELLVHRKSGWFIPAATHRYGCGET
jgi:hypothetical protein